MKGGEGSEGKVRLGDERRRGEGEVRVGEVMVEKSGLNGWDRANSTTYDPIVLDSCIYHKNKNFRVLLWQCSLALLSKMQSQQTAAPSSCPPQC